MGRVSIRNVEIGKEPLHRWTVTGELGIDRLTLIEERIGHRAKLMYHGYGATPFVPHAQSASFITRRAGLRKRILCEGDSILERIAAITVSTWIGYDGMDGG